MNEDFVSYEIALMLKKAGFDYPCYFYYTRKDAPDECVWHTTSEEAPIDYNRSVYAGCSMPTLAQAQKWLREEKLWHIEVRINDCRNMFCVELWEMKANGGAFRLQHKGGRVILYDTYESALSAGIEAALKLIEEGEE